MNRLPKCRSCDSANVKQIGRLPDGVEFAGRALSTPIPGGYLWKCVECHFVFRDPILDAEHYAMLYRNGRHDVWSIPASDRQDFRLLKSILARSDMAADVLDVGCYDGQFLSLLPENYRRFGVEINELAIEAAKQKGIEIVAASIEHIASLERKFDVVVACDVIEHLPNPMEFLQSLTKVLKPSGRIIISTGNADSWLWRLCGGDFWYCSFPEHISFIGSSWLARMPRRINLVATEIVRFNYTAERVITGRTFSALQRTVKLAARNALRRATSGKNISILGHGATRDHLVCVLSVSG